MTIQDLRKKQKWTLGQKIDHMFMNYTNNGITYREAMRKVLAVNGLELPDEKKQLKLF